jgi:hypothetical protein
VRCACASDERTDTDADPRGAHARRPLAQLASRPPPLARAGTHFGRAKPARVVRSARVRRQLEGVVRAPMWSPPRRAIAFPLLRVALGGSARASSLMASNGNSRCLECWWALNEASRRLGKFSAEYTSVGARSSCGGAVQAASPRERAV